MGQVKVIHDRIGNTLTVWFGNKNDEYICEEIGNGVILMKDRNNQVIGFERLYFTPPEAENLQLNLETVEI